MDRRVKPGDDEMGQADRNAQSPLPYIVFAAATS